jgi:hypothetical protein
MQFQLRTVLIFTTLVAAAFAWWSHSARQQREAVASLRNVNARVYYGYCDTTGTRNISDSGIGAWPQWLVDRLGVDYFAAATYVDLGSWEHRHPQLGIRRTAIDGALVHLESLPRLTDLNLGYTDTSDSGLSHVRNLTELEGLGLNGTLVSDTGMHHLARLKRLEWLNLHETHVTDDGLKQLRTLTSLKDLDIRETPTTRQAAAQLQEALPGCKIRR